MDGDDLTLTRRDALAAGAAVVVAASLPNPLFAAVPEHAIPDASVTLHVNGAVHRPSRMTPCTLRLAHGCAKKPSRHGDRQALALR
jgi:hypothetical protein